MSFTSVADPVWSECFCESGSSIFNMVWSGSGRNIFLYLYKYTNFYGRIWISNTAKCLSLISHCQLSLLILFLFKSCYSLLNRLICHKFNGFTKFSIFLEQIPELSSFRSADFLSIRRPAAADDFPDFNSILADFPLLAAGLLLATIGSTMV